MHRSCESKVSLTCSPQGNSNFSHQDWGVPGAGSQPAQGPWRVMPNALAAHWGSQPLSLPLVSGQMLHIPHQDPSTSVCAWSWHEPGFTDQFGPCAVPWKGVPVEGMEPSNTLSALIPTAAQLWHLATALLLQPSGTASQLPPGQATIPLGKGGGGEGKKKGRKRMNPHKNVFITGNVS